MEKIIKMLVEEFIFKARNAGSLLERLVVAVEGINEKLGGKKEPYEKPAVESILFPEEIDVHMHMPTDDDVVRGWAELAKRFGYLPRLANALNRARLDITRENGKVSVRFSVVNDGQKMWIEEKLLQDINATLAEILCYDLVDLSVYVGDDDAATETEEDMVPKAANSHKRFSHEEDNVIRKMYHEGKTDAEIAEFLKRTPKSIKNRRFELGLVMHKKKRV